ncbi:hypothetical protein F5I97DRAFT_1943585 [Phlebopus sp. FC_14]|nr:hypothetical protein F5I97DRAFT_1943585 [Phlebopus sp. FC_14]
MFTLFTTFFIALMSFLALTVSLPVHLQPRDVFVPHILYPHAGTVWIAGNHHNVTWETDNAPVNITNPQGMVYLASNGRIDLDNQLAGGFNILDGRVEIQVPYVPTGSNYAIVCNPNFTIIAA